MRCENPRLFRRNVTDKPVLVPCGRCYSCCSSRANDWKVRVCHDIIMCRRNEQEKRGQLVSSDSSMLIGAKKSVVFFDLTHNNGSLPEDQSVHGEILQKFLKRLRQHLSRLGRSSDFRYIACSEYGPNGTHRPHYHLLIWNFDLVRMKDIRSVLSKAWSRFVRSDSCPEGEYVSNGFIKCDKVYSVGGAVDYVTKYICKKDEHEYCLGLNESASEFQVRTGRKAPFFRASKNIGLDYFYKFRDALAHAGCVHLNGYSYRLPRYYVRRLRENETVEEVAALLKRKMKANYKEFGLEPIAQSYFSDVVNYVYSLRRFQDEEVAFFKAFRKETGVALRKTDVEKVTVLCSDGLQLISGDVPQVKDMHKSLRLFAEQGIVGSFCRVDGESVVIDEKLSLAKFQAACFEWRQLYVDFVSAYNRTLFLSAVSFQYLFPDGCREWHYYCSRLNDLMCNDEYLERVRDRALEYRRVRMERRQEAIRSSLKKRLLCFVG